jgi:hypothetical protein
VGGSYLCDVLQACQGLATARVLYPVKANAERLGCAAVATVKLAGQYLRGDVKPGQAVGRKAGGCFWPWLLGPFRLGWCWCQRCFYRYRLGNSGGLALYLPDSADGWLWLLEGRFHGSAFPASAPNRTNGIYSIEKPPFFIE